MRFRLVVLLALLGGISVPSWSADIVPPSTDFRHVQRVVEGWGRFDLVSDRRAGFSIFVTDPNDEILSAAAADLARYFRSRWASAPLILSSSDRARANDAESRLIVLASLASSAKLPAEFQPAVAQNRDLAEQAFVIQRVALPGHGIALLCLGGNSIGARYATVEILRRMRFDRQHG